MFIALKYVLIGLSAEGNEKELKELVNIAEEHLKQSFHSQQSSVTESVWLNNIKKISPNFSPIAWAVKPPEGSYIDNVLKWGVGAVNVDECRIGYQNEKIDFNRKQRGHTLYASSEIKEAHRPVYETDNYKKANIDLFKKEGRFPANVILDEEAGRLLDEQSGDNKGKYSPPKARHREAYHALIPSDGMSNAPDNYGDSGGASRFFYCAKASRSERNAGLEGMEEKEGQAYRSIRKNRGKGYPESTIIKNNHPTVKPIKLFMWLIQLVTREGQLMLDPFIGSGTTAIAAHNTGRKCIGIEKEEEYLEIAKRRIEHWKNQPKQMEMGI